jgi:cellulose synthase (UDP-forming)
MISVPARARRHRSGLVLPQPPDDAEKHSYASRSLPYLTICLSISAACIIASQLWFEAHSLIALPFAGYTALYAAYQVVSLPSNFLGRGFSLARHQALVAGWKPARLPSVDIFLPVCREPIEVLRNTWIGVFELIHAYPGAATAYVLDDGDSNEARTLAGVFGFSYVRRPVHRYKKAGNLNHTFAATSGEHIVVFDADFRPRPDFLAETLPYLDDPEVGIVQTPQFFRFDRGQTWVEQAAGATLEVFYRAVQVSRDRFGSALCVGSNAVYRRAALARAGGFTLIPYAEDSHTGLDARRHGYDLRYLPVPLAAGVCPSSLAAFMRQQYRWCCGATSLIWTPHMWRVRMPARSRLPYLAGWLWNLTTGVRTLVVPLIPVVLLAWLPGDIRLRNAIWLVPPVINGMILYPLWHNSPYSPRIWPLAIAVGWAQVLALWDFGRGQVMSWEPSRGPSDAGSRLWWGVLLWNGILALAWSGLAAWRIEQTGSRQFTVMALFSVVNLLVLGRLVFPGRNAA